MSAAGRDKKVPSVMTAVAQEAQGERGAGLQGSCWFSAHSRQWGQDPRLPLPSRGRCRHEREQSVLRKQQKGCGGSNFTSPAQVSPVKRHGGAG